MITKEKIEIATCISCGNRFWTTEVFTARVKAGQEESLCHNCAIDDGDEDDNSAEEHDDFLASEPNPEDR